MQAQFDASELITQREVVSQRVSEALTARAAQFGLILDDISRPVTYAGWSSLQSPLLSFLSIFFILNSAMALVAANLIFCQG